MNRKIPSFRGTSALVVGDVMLDRYWYGTAGRVSQEAPVPIVAVQVVEDRPGGAANVALNLAALGVGVTLVGVVGDDEAAHILEAKLAAAGVRCAFVVLSDWPTIIKLRVVSRRQQVLRLDFEKPMTAPVQERLESAVQQHIGRVNVVVLQDYDKGTLAQPEKFIEMARQQHKRVVVDPKFKGFDRYRGADLIKPNDAEFSAAVGGWTDYAELVAKAAELVHTYNFGGLVVTRGDLGMTLIERGGAHHHVPARAVDVFDETGAGDTVAAALAAGLAAGCTPHESVSLANLAAGIVVTKSGTATVTAIELHRVLAAEGHADRGMLSRDELLEVIAYARLAGERIVFTNGCFDILHAGHVAYLQEARALGDRLVVAVNDDPSVTRLKGPGRPVNGLEQRIRVLSALGCVDWTVAMHEDTPEVLLALTTPDVLVKGGDYTVDAVVGADVVRGYGGVVKVLSRVDNVSTTAIVERLNRSGH